jgi:hypothetical protein
MSKNNQLKLKTKRIFIAHTHQLVSLKNIRKYSSKISKANKNQNDVVPT